MTQQKSLKRRVRARMSKTGERYTSARRQVLARTSVEPAAEAATSMPAPAPSATAGTEATSYSTSDEAMRKATGRSHAEWFVLLDAWGATAHTHTEIAEWLATAHAAPSWWRQAITVDYERARGLRGKHQMADGFTISVTRTVGVPVERALLAIRDEGLRAAWLPDAPMAPRPTRAKLTSRFSWSEPVSRVELGVAAKGARRSIVYVSHERLPDAAAGERLKAYWRERLGVLKAVLEGTPGA